MTTNKTVPPRGKGKKTLMLDAIRAEMDCEDGEHEFLREVVRIGLGRAINDKKDPGDPNPTLLNMVLSRIEPPLKSESALVEFEFDSKLNPHEQATQVLDAVAKGVIPPDIGQMFVTSIASMLKIQEITDIDERLKIMESQLDEDK
jgi:hypothetical protein